MRDRTISESRTFPWHGWIGLGLVAIFWYLNWNLSGLRTNWGFFPMWMGYSLTVDAFVYLRTGTSLFIRSWRKYLGLFLVSAPVWWIFEAFNLRLQNWYYDGGEFFTPFQFWFWATLSFSTVIPAVFGSAELAASFGFIQRLGKGPIIRGTKRVTWAFFSSGFIMIALMLLWPNYFFPFVWLSVYFILGPINVWMGNRSLTEWTGKGDWRPVVALWVGVLITGFFWEMWNFFSYPKWIYHVPYVGFLKVFEMPILGYTGYLPFAMELFAMYHLAAGLFGEKKTDYVQIAPES